MLGESRIADKVQSGIGNVVTDWHESFFMTLNAGTRVREEMQGINTECKELVGHQCQNQLRRSTAGRCWGLPYLIWESAKALQVLKYPPKYYNPEEGVFRRSSPGFREGGSKDRNFDGRVYWQRISLTKRLEHIVVV